MLGTVAEFLQSRQVADALGYNQIGEDAVETALTEYVRLLRITPGAANQLGADTTTGVFRIRFEGRASKHAERHENTMAKSLTAGVAAASLVLTARAIGAYETESPALVLGIVTAALLIGTGSWWRTRR
jgi:hypothetical protein